MDERLYRDSARLGGTQPVHHRQRGPRRGARAALRHLPRQDPGGTDRVAEG